MAAPSSQSLSTLYLTQAYAFVRRDSAGCLLVEIPARKGKDGTGSAPARKERIPLLKIDDVVVLGEVTLTASAIHLLLEREIEITFLSQFGQFKGRLSPPFSKNAVLRMAQYRAHQDMSKRCELARRFVLGKLSNQRQRLLRFHRTHQDTEVNVAIKQLTDIIGNLTTLSLHQSSSMRSLAGGDNRIAGTPLEAILGMEGSGSAAYFRCFGKLLSDPKQWPFPGVSSVPQPTQSIPSSVLATLYSRVKLLVLYN